MNKLSIITFKNFTCESLVELAECGYEGDLTLEVNYAKYADRLSKREYMQRAFDSASRLKALIEKYKGE